MKIVGMHERSWSARVMNPFVNFRMDGLPVAVGAGKSDDFDDDEDAGAKESGK